MGKRSHQVLPTHIETVESARQLKNLTHKVIAERLDCTRQPISKFFNGKPVSCDLFVAICTMLHLDWQEIADLKESSVVNVNLTESSEDQQKSEIDIELVVNQLREQVKEDIETRCGIMRILDMSQPIGLGQIYTKVNILEKIIGRRRKEITQLIEKCTREDFERFNLGEVTEEKILGTEAVSKYNKLLILGRPGAGKTTFLKHLAIQCNNNKFQGDLVPFFVTLKDFAETKNEASLLAYLGSYIKPENQNDLKQVLTNGKALILLDGLDEVLKANSKRVIKEIENLTNKYPSNQYVMTCRIAAREYTFEKFTEVEIADFDWEQITTFAKRMSEKYEIMPVFLT